MLDPAAPSTAAKEYGGILQCLQHPGKSGETDTSQTFPAGHEEKRKVLLAAVECVPDIIVAGADEAEANATLPPTTVQVLDDAGLFALKLLAVLGGAEADLATQLEILEAVSYIDTSAGWCLLIGASAVAFGMPSGSPPRHTWSVLAPPCQCCVAWSCL